MAFLPKGQTYGEALRAQRLAAKEPVIEAFPEVIGEPVKPPRRPRDHIQREASKRLHELQRGHEA